MICMSWIWDEKHKDKISKQIDNGLYRVALWYKSNENHKSTDVDVRNKFLTNMFL